jgi:hypothetical protein
MLRVKARDFFRNPYRYLKNLPLIITKRGVEKILVKEVEDSNVVTEKKEEVVND